MSNNCLPSNSVENDQLKSLIKITINKIADKNIGVK